MASSKQIQALEAFSLVGRSKRAMGSATPATIQTLPSGIASLDQILPYGGIPQGRLSEVTGRRSAGKHAIATSLCAQTLCTGRHVAWVDGTGEFYPLPSLEFGAPLDRLVVIRLQQLPLRAVLKATDLLLQARGALSLVVVGLAQRIARNPSTSQLARLRLGAEASGTAVLFVTQNAAQSASLGTFICLRLTVHRQTTNSVQVAITKSQLGRMAQQTKVTLDGPHSVRLDTTV